MMTIILYIWGGLTAISIVSMFVAIFIEKYFSEDSSVMKWWRKHIIGVIRKDDKDF